MLNILVIDNNQHFVHALSYILQDTFKQNLNKLHIAESGNEALTILSNNIDINLIFLDVDMPNLDGIETIKKLRGINKNSEVIALSFYDEETLKTNLINAGIKEYVIKENITSLVLQDIFDKVQ